MSYVRRAFDCLIGSPNGKEEGVSPHTEIPLEVWQYIAELLHWDRDRCQFRMTCQLFNAAGNAPHLFASELRLPTGITPQRFTSYFETNENRRAAVRTLLLEHDKLLVSCGHDDCDRFHHVSVIRHKTHTDGAYDATIAAALSACPAITCIRMPTCVLQRCNTFAAPNDFQSLRASITKLELDGGCNSEVFAPVFRRLVNLRHLVIMDMRSEFSDLLQTFSKSRNNPCLASVEQLDIDMNTIPSYGFLLIFLPHCCKLRVFRFRAPATHNPWGFLACVTVPSLERFEFCGKTHRPETVTAVCTIRNPRKILEMCGDDIILQLQYHEEVEMVVWRNVWYGDGLCQRVCHGKYPGNDHYYDVTGIDTGYTNRTAQLPVRFSDDPSWYGPHYTARHCTPLEAGFLLYNVLAERQRLWSSIATVH